MSEDSGLGQVLQGHDPESNTWLSYNTETLAGEAEDCSWWHRGSFAYTAHALPAGRSQTPLASVLFWYLQQQQQQGRM